MRNLSRKLLFALEISCVGAMRAPSRQPLLAYASVGKSGDFGGAGLKEEGDAQTWTFTCGAGWLYGLGLCIGPFFGTGVGFTFPGGVLAGAGGGVGVVIGVGMGSGLVWGSGRGVVKGLGVIPPMSPPFAEGLPRPADLPSPDELARRTADQIDLLRLRIARRTAEMRGRSRSRPPLGFARSSTRGEGTWHSRKLVDPRWPVS